MLDGARAIQYLRSRSKELGLDAERIAASGSSAGAGIALWIGFHDDLADPRSPDPIARQSTRLACIGVDGAQSSYDPRFIRQVVGGRAHEHAALPLFFGLSDSERDSPKAHKLYEAASPINLATTGDPPVYLFYEEPDEPLPPDAQPGQGIHHPRFGAALKAKLDPLGVECILRHAKDLPETDHPKPAMFREMIAFFLRHLEITCVGRIGLSRAGNPVHRDLGHPGDRADHRHGLDHPGQAAQPRNRENRHQDRFLHEEPVRSSLTGVSKVVF
jgi:acetyl esterase/lipase